MLAQASSPSGSAGASRPRSGPGSSRRAAPSPDGGIIITYYYYYYHYSIVMKLLLLMGGLRPRSPGRAPARQLLALPGPRAPLHRGHKIIVRSNSTYTSFLSLIWTCVSSLQVAFTPLPCKARFQRAFIHSLSSLRNTHPGCCTNL